MELLSHIHEQYEPPPSSDCLQFVQVTRELIVRYWELTSRGCGGGDDLKAAHSYFCAHSRHKIDRTKPEYARICCVLAFLGTEYLCRCDPDSAYDLKPPTCCGGHKWEDISSRFRRGWSKFTLEQVRNAVESFVCVRREPKAVHADAAAPNSEKVLGLNQLFHDAPALSRWLCTPPVQDSSAHVHGKSDSEMMLSIEKLRMLVEFFADNKELQIGAWSTLLTQFALAIDVLRNSTVPALVALFLTFSDEDYHKTAVSGVPGKMDTNSLLRALISAACNILHRVSNDNYAALSCAIHLPPAPTDATHYIVSNYHKKAPMSEDSLPRILLKKLQISLIVFAKESSLSREYVPGFIFVIKTIRLLYEIAGKTGYIPLSDFYNNTVSNGIDPIVELNDLKVHQLRSANLGFLANSSSATPTSTSSSTPPMIASSDNEGAVDFGSSSSSSALSSSSTGSGVLNGRTAVISYIGDYLTNDSTKGSKGSKQVSNSQLSVLNYPFILTPRMKAELLVSENGMQMRREQQAAFFHSMFRGVQSPHLDVHVRRSAIVEDTICQLQNRTSHDLRKQLRVQFDNEPAVDEGGVQREFFHLLAQRIFSVDFGMFRATSSGLLWFQWRAPEECDEQVCAEYRLVGTIFGLAIYNGVLLNVRFPITLYRLILGLEVGYGDLMEIDPQLAEGLRKLAEYDPEAVEEDFCRNFVHHVVDPTGNLTELELVKNGASVPLTGENRNFYIERLVQLIVLESHKIPVEALLAGFTSVVHNMTLQLFDPEELQLLVVGQEDLDFTALESNARYEGGYSPETPIIRAFWDHVHSFPSEKKRRLLFFVTGSERAPIGGLGKLDFVVARNGPNSQQLPSSHTCFNILLLPEYETPEQLISKLDIAIQNTEGFGLI